MGTRIQAVGPESEPEEIRPSKNPGETMFLNIGRGKEAYRVGKEGGRHWRGKRGAKVTWSCWGWGVEADCRGC